MKTIAIVVAPNGQVRVETNGFAGGQCREASRFLEQALGKRQSETLTEEFYRAQSRLSDNTHEKI